MSKNTQNINHNNSVLDNSERTKCEIWTRVMGYHRPVSSFNRGKKGEYNERINFHETRAVHNKHMK